MRRVLAMLLAVGTVAACRPYDNYAPLVSQDGLIPATQYAKYGSEQAQAVAIGRALAAWYQGDSPDALAKRTEMAVAYAKKLPGVVSVDADTLGHRLTVTFKSGWRTAIVPIDDGVQPGDTPGVPKD